jgi:hypothetical protein
VPALALAALGQVALLDHCHLQCTTRMVTAESHSRQQQQQMQQHIAHCVCSHAMPKSLSAFTRTPQCICWHAMRAAACSAPRSNDTAHVGHLADLSYNRELLCMLCAECTLPSCWVTDSPSARRSAVWH